MLNRRLYAIVILAFLISFPLFYSPTAAQFLVGNLRPITTETANLTVELGQIVTGNTTVFRAIPDSRNTLILVQKRRSGILYPPPDPISEFADALQVWDLDTAARRCVLSGHQGFVTFIEISADGRFVATASDDGTLRIWLMNDCSEVWRTQLIADRWADMTFSADGRYLGFIASYIDDNESEDYAVMVDLNNNFETLRELRRRYLMRISFSPDSSTMAIGTIDQYALLVNIASGETSEYLLNSDNRLPFANLGFSRNGQMLFADLMDKFIVVDMSSRSITATYGQSYPRDLQRTRLTDLVLQNRYREGIDVIDFTTEELRVTLPPLNVIGPGRGVDPTETILVTTDSNQLNLYDLQTGEALISLDHRDVFDVSFSADNRLLISWGYESNVIKLWGIQGL